MKKLFYAMALLAFVLVLPSCGGNDDDDEQKTKEEQKTKCTYTFWTDDDYGHGTYTVNLWNDEGYDKTLTVTNYYANTPDCGAAGCANFSSLEPGTYSYYAETEDELFYWMDEVTLTKECHTMMLYISEAKVNVNAQPREVSKLEPAVMDFDLNNIVNN